MYGAKKNFLKNYTYRVVITHEILVVTIYIKQQCRLCYLCKNSNRNDQHMWEKHKIDIVSYKRVWQEIKEYHDTEAEKHNKMKTIMKLKREVFLEYWKPLLKTLKSETDEKFDKIYNLNKRKASVNEKLQSK